MTIDVELNVAENRDWVAMLQRHLHPLEDAQCRSNHRQTFFPAKQKFLKTQILIKEKLDRKESGIFQSGLNSFPPE